MDIEESSGITNLEVPAIKFANEIETIKKRKDAIIININKLIRFVNTFNN